MRLELIQESKEELEKEKTSIDVNQIELLYNKASKLIPTLQVTFEETVKFHNDLINEKIKFIEANFLLYQKDYIVFQKKLLC